MRYKIDFGITFLVSIFIMIFGQFWQLLDSQPEAFPYGNEIYHFLSIFFYVLSELAIGTAAAILFYFMLQYLEKNKTIELYTDYRVHMIRVLYFHMKVLKDVEEFKDLKETAVGQDDFYTILDIPRLINIYNGLTTEEKLLQFKQNLKIYFMNADFQRLDRIYVSLEEDIKELEQKKEISYFKGSKDLIEGLTSYFGDMGDFSIIYSLLMHADDAEHINDYADEMVKDYLAVLDASIVLYEEFEEFINAIQNKRIFKFIKMLN